MEQLIGAAIFGQSGGPTSVINASAQGVFEALFEHKDIITKVYGAANGIRGMLNEEFFDMSLEDGEQIKLLKTTPSSALGSVRYKMDKEEDYAQLLKVFKKYNIRYFFYNGGNDSMDTCNKVSKYMANAGYEVRCMGVPKTIDNDLYGTDHCPGFGSAAKYIATSLMEVYLDARVYDTGMIVVIEVMGRHAGWLAASAALASYKGLGPDLIYLPEVVFDYDKFFDDIKEVYKKNHKVIAVVSEGISDKTGELIGASGEVDAFGHKKLGQTAVKLTKYVENKFERDPDFKGCKYRAIELSLLQRCAAHCASLTDVDESYLAGRTAALAAVDGKTDFCVGFERSYDENNEYHCNTTFVPLSLIANTEKKFPLEWLNEDKNFVTDEFIKYALPLIQGESKVPLEDGLPKFAKLKKVKAVK